MEQQIFNYEKLKTLIPYYDIQIKNAVFFNNCLTGQLLKTPKIFRDSVSEMQYYKMALAFHEFLEQVQYLFIFCITKNLEKEIHQYQQSGRFDLKEELINAFISGKELLSFEMVLIETKMVKGKFRVKYSFVIHGYGKIIATVFVEKSE